MTENTKLWNEYIINLKNKLNNYIPKIFNDTEYTAIIVEPRIQQDFEVIVKNIMYFLNESNSNIKWGLHIFHGNANKEYVENIVKNWKNVKLTNIIFHNFTPHEYNDWIRTKKFWNQVTTPNVLMFQTDSCLLKHGIDEFLDWDYIGAPWVKPKESKWVGNGGLSFRKTKKMIDIIEKNLYLNYINEDIYFCKYIQNLPPISVAKKFSVEDVYYENPLGIHQPKIEPQKLKEILDKSLERIKV